MEMKSRMVIAKGCGGGHGECFMGTEFLFGRWVLVAHNVNVFNATVHLKIVKIVTFK